MKRYTIRVTAKGNYHEIYCDASDIVMNDNILQFVSNDMLITFQLENIIVWTREDS